ncbi:MAG TPA: CoA pyrophosphatase [Stellaceae bacterium]|jgi:8-oxo-dGTP pyrophosphatase MutT (NUDIX family)|nr:CoA pyrophosphatase [Stellaceae bacterium]
MEQRDVFPAGPGNGRGLSRAAIRAHFLAPAIGTRGNGTREADNIRAAVLVPLIERPHGWYVLLTLRSADLSDHAGQISFPGGRIEPEDPDAVHAALREAEEEVGLPTNHVEVVGRLDTWLTGTGFEITPVVGLVRPPESFAPQPGEVAEVFEVPLDFVLDPGNHLRRSRELRGELRSFFVLPYQHRNIWGATAGMLVNLAEALTR